MQKDTLASWDKIISSGKGLRLIYDSISDRVTVQDRAFRIVSYNKAVEERYGRGLEGKLCYRAYRKRNDVCPECTAARAIETRSRTETVLSIPGNPPVEVTVYPVFDDGGEVIGFVEHDRTMASRWSMEELPGRRQEPGSIELLAGSMAHDFCNILTSVINNIFVAKSLILPGDRAFSKLVSAEKASMRARELTNRFMSLSRDGGALKGLCPLRELVEEVTVFSLALSPARCECDIPDGLWPVEVDRTQLAQVLNNLIINSDHAMPEGGLIRISAENIVRHENGKLPLEEGRYVKLSVRDSGSGIPENLLPRVFEPHFTTKKQGRGLGLASAYFIVKRHGGHIEVESNPGSGTAFHLYLPASERRMRQREEIETIPSRGKGKILLMEDDREIREPVGEALALMGYDVHSVAEGSGALALYVAEREADRPFDVVVMDLITRCGMGAEETVKLLLAEDSGAKVVLTSGSPFEPAVADFKNRGFRAAITKPYRVEELSSVLQSLTGP